MEALDDISIASLKAALSNTDDAMLTQRLLAAISYKQGDDIETLADRHDVSEPEIEQWFRAVATAWESSDSGQEQRFRGGSDTVVLPSEHDTETVPESYLLLDPLNLLIGAGLSFGMVLGSVVAAIAGPLLGRQLAPVLILTCILAGGTLGVVFAWWRVANEEA
jgi:hypothetical protein